MKRLLVAHLSIVLLSATGCRLGDAFHPAVGGNAESPDMATTTDDSVDMAGGADLAISCPAGYTACNGQCGCGASCAVCQLGAHATGTTCDGYQCGLQCASGYHLCGGNCVSNTDPNTCGTSCSACPPPIGGTATCDGTSCGATCPSGQKLCLGSCIPQGMACNGSCPTGTHDCSGNCVSDTSTNSCGTSCTPCSPPANSMATCSGGSCGFTCATNYKQCGSNCIPVTGCCSTNDCTQPANGSATCNTSTNMCVITCNNGYTQSGSMCVPWTCPNQGQSCTAGVGACMNTGTIVCTAQGVGACSATAGAPDNSGTWHQSAAANGSFDWNCDGHIQYQYPTGDTTRPPNDNDSSAITDCTTIGVQSVCPQPHWYYSYWNHWADPCGHPVDDAICYWNVNSCASSGGNEVTEGCH